MHWIESKIELLPTIDANSILKHVEFACRMCYKSHDKITEHSAEKLIKHCLTAQHESVLEHVQLSFQVVLSRSTLAQWTRHRIASYSVESQRYCNYTKDKFSNEITFIKPHWYSQIPFDVEFGSMTDKQKQIWSMWSTINAAAHEAEENYELLINLGAKPEDAREVLPNMTKTEMVWSANLREIRHFIKLRSSHHADPNIRKLAVQLIAILQQHGLGILIEDLVEVE